jgi:hypothetical protein
MGYEVTAPYFDAIWKIAAAKEKVLSFHQIIEVWNNSIHRGLLIGETHADMSFDEACELIATHYDKRDVRPVRVIRTEIDGIDITTRDVSEEVARALAQRDGARDNECIEDFCDRHGVSL